MEWYQVLVIILSVFGMFLWSRKDSRDEIREIRKDMRDFREIWSKETMEFHGRLCTLEERYLQFKIEKPTEVNKEGK